MKTKRQSESPLVHAAIALLRASGHPCARTGSGTTFVPKKDGGNYAIKNGTAGWPDISGTWKAPRSGFYGRSFYVECKMPGKDLSVMKLNKRGVPVPGQLETLTELWDADAMIFVLYGGYEDRFADLLNFYVINPIPGASPWLRSQNLWVLAEEPFTKNVRKLVENCGG